MYLAFSSDSCPRYFVQSLPLIWQPDAPFVFLLGEPLSASPLLLELAGGLLEGEAADRFESSPEKVSISSESESSKVSLEEVLVSELEGLLSARDAWIAAAI